MLGSDKLLSFVMSVATQVRAAIEVGVPIEDTAEGQRMDGRAANFGLLEPENWDDAPGRITRNGLGSLEIGAGKTRVDE